MSQGSMGGAELVTELVTRSFEADLKKLETTVLSSVKTMSAAFDNVISPKAFSGAKGDVQALSGVLKPLSDQLKQVQTSGAGLGGVLGTGATTAKRALDPLSKSVNDLRGGVTILQQKLELGELAEREFTDQTKKLQGEIRGAITGTEAFGREQVALYRALGQSERGLKTVSGEATRFGIAQQTTIGINRSLLGQLDNFGPVGRGAAVGIDAFGGSLGALPVALPVVGAIVGLGVATTLLVKKGKPELEAYQRAMNVLAQSGEKDLGRFKGVLTDLQTEGGKAAQTFSRAELAGALSETVKAGVSATDALTLLKTGTQLASAENEDLAGSTELVLKNLRQYGLGVDQASRAGDALATAGNLAAGSAADLSEGLATVGPVANKAGFSLEETLGILVNLDNKGLSAAQEGATGLRSVLATLAKPSDPANAAIEGLGVSLVNLDGSTKGVKQRLFEVRDAIAGSGKDLTEFAAIADTQALTALLALDDSTDTYTASILDSQGALKSYAETMANDAANAEKRQDAALRDLASTAREFFAPAITGAAVAITELLRGIDTFFTRLSGGSKPVDDLTLKFEGARDVIGSATDKKTLAGTLDSLSTQLDGSSKTAFVNLSKEVRTGIGNFEDFKAAAQNLLDEAKLSAEIAQVATELSALESREIAINFSSDLNNVDAVIKDAEARINSSPLVQGRGIQLELGFKEVNGKQVVSILNDVGSVAGETSIEVANLNDRVQGMLAQGSQGSALSYEQGKIQKEVKATQDKLTGLEDKLTDLQAGYADTGEAAKAAFREAQDELARTVNEIDFGGYLNSLFINLSIKDPQKLQAELQALVSNTKLEIEAAPNPQAKAEAQARLVGYEQALGAAKQLVSAQENLNTVTAKGSKTPPVQPVPKPTIKSIEDTATAAEKTATQFETAMNAATAWATRLTREAQQNVKPAAEVIGTFKDRVVELQKEQERLAKAGLAGGKQYDLAEQKISLLTGAIDELSGSQSKAENSGNDLSTSLGQLADKSFHAGDAERERVAQVIKSVDAQNAADAAVKSVIGGVDAYTAKNREAQDRLENLTSVTEYYTREVESSYDPLDAQIKQNKTNITVLGDVVKAQSEWNERLKISNKDLPKTVDYANDFSTALSKLNANAQDVTGAFDGVDDITGGMEDAAAEAKLLGEEFDSSGVCAVLTLISFGQPKPISPQPCICSFKTTGTQPSSTTVPAYPLHLASSLEVLTHAVRT